MVAGSDGEPELAFEARADDDDEVFESSGLWLCVDSRSVAALRGAIIDYEQVPSLGRLAGFQLRKGEPE